MKTIPLYVLALLFLFSGSLAFAEETDIDTAHCDAVMAVWDTYLSSSGTAGDRGNTALIKAALHERCNEITLAIEEGAVGIGVEQPTDTQDATSADACIKNIRIPSGHEAAANRASNARLESYLIKQCEKDSPREES